MWAPRRCVQLTVKTDGREVCLEDHELLKCEIVNLSCEDFMTFCSDNFSGKKLSFDRGGHPVQPRPLSVKKFGNAKHRFRNLGFEVWVAFDPQIPILAAHMIVFTQVQ